MIKEVNVQKNFAEALKKNDAVLKIKSPSKTLKPSVPPPFAATSFAGQDKLAASIVSFARFFSLPLKPETLADIRRQTPPLRQENAAAREAFSLAAAAAEGKGAELNYKGLLSYADAIDPDARHRREDGGGNQKQDRRRNREQDERVESICADSVKKKALENMEKYPLPEILNRMPGKDGKRWIVLPFDFSHGENEYRVSMRVLLDDKQMSNRAACMALDVKSTNGGKHLFVLESVADKPASVFVYLRREFSGKESAKIKSDLSELLGVSPEKIFVKKREESFPYEAAYAGNPSSVNEAF